MREIVNISSHYDAKTRTTTVQVGVSDRDAAGILIRHRVYTGEATWNKKDTFDPMEGIKVAYHRAIKQISKDTIIEKCGGLRNGDWVRMESKDSGFVIWGIVFNNNILYMMGSGNFDRVSTFSDGETEFDRITMVIRPTTNSYPITYDVIHLGLYTQEYVKKHCEIYTAD